MPKLHSATEAREKISLFLKTTCRPLIALVGPTASGKTVLSLEWAHFFSGEVVNADSRQFYRNMNIGTAKITPEEQNGIPHHLFDFLSPAEPFSVALFQKAAFSCIDDILSRKKIPFLVGGSGLFVNAVCENFAIPPSTPLPELEKKSDAELFLLLTKQDPKSASKINANNRRRVIRALEIFFATGQKKSDLPQKNPPKYDVLKIGIGVDPKTLSRLIEKRNTQMWADGFLEEVCALVKMGFRKEDPAMIAHGYREAMDFLAGKKTEEETKREMVKKTRSYAKRQRTWWRRDPHIFWISSPYCS